MKPEKMPQAEYDKRMADAKKLLEDDPESARFVKLMPMMIEVIAGAGVLWEQMLAAGATPEEMKSLQHVHGQACFPMRDPWKTADALFTRWSNGRAPTPGREFGKALLEGPREAIADLPMGGLRVVKVS